MAEQIVINSVIGGISPSQYLGSGNTYSIGVGIDPDMPITETGVKTSAQLFPVTYAKFSGTEFTGAPLFIMSNPKDTNTYVYSSDGKIHSFDSSLSMRAGDFPITVTNGAGNGAAYYNNYIYVAENTDITRYGPLDNSPSEVENVWTGATLGSQTALTNTTYPSIRSIEIPNHPMHVHVDNALYFGDVLNGQGIIHKIITKKTTNEGDTNNNSAYNVLDLPFGFFPTAIESYGTDLVILAIQTTDASINQGKAALFFWDTIADSFYRQVPVSDPLGTALLNHNGVLYIWSGNGQDGVRLSRYIGGDSLQDIAFLEEGAPPFSGAVCGLGNRVYWGGYTTYPVTSASVFSIGSKDFRLPYGIHNIVNSSSGGANPNITALNIVQQSSNKIVKVLPGWSDDSNKGLDKYSASSTLTSVWRSDTYSRPYKFTIKKIIVRLGKAVAANMSIVPKIYVDDLSGNTTLTTINNTNYSSSERRIEFFPNVYCENNFLLEFTWGGTATLPILLPIIIEIEKASQ